MDNNKDKRILWLINHTTLREFEVPLLISLGYEVYTPKCIPDLIYEWSGSVDYTYDNTLTIPEEKLQILNQHDFYEKPLTQPIVSIINRYFGTAFCVFYPNLFEQITRQFNGRILLRAFGLDKSSTYSQILRVSCGNDFLSRLKLLGDRFWFSQSYTNLHEIEDDALKLRKVDHPLGLPDSFFEKQNTWVGGIKKILFFCSRIKASPSYYGKIYAAFKKNFGDIPHHIAGTQPIPVKDSCVAGHQPRATIDKWLQTYDVMFYHSEEPRHLHYHPLEAIIFGMPLVYMKQGILGQLGGEHQPGACLSINEARQKIGRILNGDKTLIENIRQSQRRMLESFSLDFNLREWQTHFVNKVMATPLAPDSSSTKTIGVFLPVGYRGGSLNGAKNIAKMLHLGSRQEGEPVNVIFSCVANEYNIQEDFADLLELGISVSETHWKQVSKQQVEIMLKLSGENQPLTHPEYTIPTQGVSNFNECDFWFIVSDRVAKPLAPIKPYGMMIYDYIQRYVPQIFDPAFSDAHFISTARHAQFVFATTPTTLNDTIQYAGLSPYRTHLAPMEFDTLDYPASNRKIADHYFLWPTNTTPHKNHVNAIKALDIYYRKLDGKLKVVMTGPGTDVFNHSADAVERPYLREVIMAMHEYPMVKDNLIIVGNLTKGDYISTLQSAKFLWHPAIIDNGTYAVVEAAYYGIPALSSNYPQMNFMNKRFNLDLNFCESTQPENMALQLKMMEEQYQTKQQHLPKKEFLDQFGYKKIAPEFWNLIRGLL